MSAREVIAEAIAKGVRATKDPAMWSRMADDERRIYRDDADNALAALDAAGYEVVKLPAPSGHDCYLRDVWDVSADYQVIRYPDGAVGLAENGGFVTEYSPDAAIDLAAALLAAARHAEGSES